MPALYKRGQTWWAKFYHRGRAIRRSMKTRNRQLARERARLLESSIKDGSFSVAAACTSTPLPDALEEFCAHLRATRTTKAAQTEIYRLRQLFGPAYRAELKESCTDNGTPDGKMTATTPAFPGPCFGRGGQARPPTSRNRHQWRSQRLPFR